MIFQLFKSLKRFDDNELVARYKSTGNMRYAAEIYKRYSQLIAGICFQYLKNPMDAEDAAMDVFEIITKDLKRLEVNKLNNWLYSVAKHHCLKVKRRKQRLSFTEQLEQEHPDFFVENGDDLSLLQKIDDELRYEALENALKDLKADQKTCVELFYLQHMSYGDIVEVTGFDLKKVKSYIQNGKRNLKLKLEEELEQKA